MEYKKRIADDLLKEKLKSFGAVQIKGPKACGKTTTSKQFAKTVIEFEDEDLRDNYLEIASFAPSNLLKGDKPLLLDEWQDAPKIWGAVRKYVDDANDTGLFILTGSTSKEVNTPHTGTGRISTFLMYPMSLYESNESNGSISLSEVFENKNIEVAESKLSLDGIIKAICRGGRPRSLFLDDKYSDNVAEDIASQIANVDIYKIVTGLRKSDLTKKILKSYSRNICTLASKKTIYADVNQEKSVSYSIFDSIIDGLKDLNIIEDIEAWCPSIRSKTSIRSSEKRNLIDPSLAVAYLGIDEEYLKKDFKTLGFLFKCLCIRDLRVYSQKLGGEISYYHDRYGLEADAVLHIKNGKYALIEFKLGGNQLEEGAKHLLKIEDLIKKYNEEEKQTPLDLPSLKIIITATQYAYKREDGVFVIPLACLKP